MPSTELWIILILLARLGLTLHTVGSVRARSAAATAGRSLVEFATVVVAAYAPGRVVHTIMGDVAGEWPRAAVQSIAWAVVPAGLIGSALAERTRIRASVILTVTGGVLAGGFANILSDAVVRSFEFAGPMPHAGIIYITCGATAAIVSAKITGGRHRKYNRDGSTNIVPAHNVPMLIAGDLLLLGSVGLTIGGLSGAAPALICAAITLLSGAVIMTLVDRRIDVVSAGVCGVSGAVLGAVSGHDSLTTLAAACVLGVLTPWAIRKADLRFRIDDPGMLAVPVLLAATLAVLARSTDGGNFSPAAIAGPVAILLTSILIASFLSGVAAFALRAMSWLRVAPTVESDGLDLAEHDVNAYPDFQQTMIKSYHLRQ